VTPIVEFMALFAEFRRPSWEGWRAVLARLTSDVLEFFCIVGRGAGESRIVALLACAFASRDSTRVSGLFQTHIANAGRGPYDVLPDGQHFVILQASDQPLDQMTIVVNWASVLRR
jgi:hypothetical protein